MKKCIRCGVEFEHEAYKEGYCSWLCRVKHLSKTCEVCGSEFLALPDKTKTKCPECDRGMRKDWIS